MRVPEDHLAMAGTCAQMLSWFSQPHAGPIFLFVRVCVLRPRGPG